MPHKTVDANICEEYELADVTMTFDQAIDEPLLQLERSSQSIQGSHSKRRTTKLVF